ncbi:MAG: YfcC family protein, partial [Bacteroidia bacterium]|nr:YfcC family protein [Bacteroidia bacterium]
METKKKKREFPNTYVIIFAIILLSALATWFVGGGEYVKTQEVAGVAQVEFKEIPSQGQWWSIMEAFYNGFTKQSGIICFILVIGAAFWIVNKSRAIDATIFSFLNGVTKLEKNKFLAKIGVGNVVIVLIMLVFSVFGAIFGMSEETIAFTIILVPLAISMGYDSIVGVCLVYVAAHVGFAGAILNPFTIGIA